MKTLAQIIPPTNQHNKQFLDLIVRLLDFDPDTRLTVENALKHPYLSTPTPEPFPNVSLKVHPHLGSVEVSFRVGSRVIGQRLIGN